MVLRHGGKTTFYESGDHSVGNSDDVELNAFVSDGEGPFKPVFE